MWLERGAAVRFRTVNADPPRPQLILLPRDFCWERDGVLGLWAQFLSLWDCWDTGAARKGADLVLWVRNCRWAGTLVLVPTTQAGL